MASSSSHSRANWGAEVRCDYPDHFQGVIPPPSIMSERPSCKQPEPLTGTIPAPTLQQRIRIAIAAQDEKQQIHDPAASPRRLLFRQGRKHHGHRRFSRRIDRPL